MFSSIQTYLMAGLAVGLIIVCGLFYWYFDHSQKKIEILAGNQAKLESAVGQQKAVINYMQQTIDTQNEALTKLQKDQVAAEKVKGNLEAKLRKHELEALAKDKPNLVEDKINDATRKRFREMENDTNN